MRWRPADFVFLGTDDFVRLDELCAEVLREFFLWMQTQEGGALEPEAASGLAHAADRFLRDFVVDILETGPADSDPSFPRRYLGNWYIVNTLTPSHQEMDLILLALRKLYNFLGTQGIVDESVAGSVARELAEGAPFHQRLEDFWALSSEGISAWRKVNDYRVRRRPEDVN